MSGKRSAFFCRPHTVDRGEAATCSADQLLPNADEGAMRLLDSCGFPPGQRHTQREGT